MARSIVAPDHHVVVAIDDDQVLPTVRAGGHRCEVIPLRTMSPRLPMAAARNVGARTALDAGPELLIFLDVDCIPAPGLVGRYVRVAEQPDHRDALLCGPVTYRSPPEPGGYDVGRLTVDPHSARPAPEDYEMLVSTDYELFWSLAFAVAAPVWELIGGFCSEYPGYGGEDTDFASRPQPSRSRCAGSAAPKDSLPAIGWPTAVTANE